MISELLVKDKMGGRQGRTGEGGKKKERKEEWLLVGEQGDTKGNVA